MLHTGDRIKLLRKERGWSQTQLGEKVNVSMQVVSNWERRYTGLGDDDVAILAKVFDVSADFLLGKSEMRKNETSISDENFKKTIELIEKVANKMGLSTSDPVFEKMLSDAFELIRIARGKDNN
jgi:transcriptional regulator with XRE-family HTH domain